MHVVLKANRLNGSRASVDRLLEELTEDLADKDLIVDLSESEAATISFFQQICKRAFEADAHSVIFLNVSRSMQRSLDFWLPPAPERFSEKSREWWEWASRVVVVPRES